MKQLARVYKTIRLGILLLATYLVNNRRLFFFGLVVGVCAIVFLPQFLFSFDRKKTPVVGLVGNYTVSTLPISLQKKLSMGLTRTLANGEATTGAALSWKDENENKQITFELDKNLFWQDGTKFEVKDINYNLRGVGVKEVSPTKVQFTLQEPFAPLPVILSQPLFKNGLVGLGEHRLENIRMNGRFISSLTLQNLADGEKITYKFFPNEETAALALKLGETSSIEAVHSKFDFFSDPHYKITDQTDYSSVATLFYNTRSDLLSDKSVRQGLTYALPNSFTEGERAYSPLAPQNWAYNTGAKHYPQNLGTAKKQIEKVASTSAKVTLNLATSRDLQKTAESIAKIWSEIGVPTTVTVVNVIPQNFDAYLTYLDLPDDPDQYALWHSTQRGNITAYKSARVDSLLENGRKTSNRKEREAIYDNFQRAITEDAPAAFLFYPRTYTITRQ